MAGSSVHGILQARILEWVAIPSPGDLPNPGIEPRFPALQADSLPTELQRKIKHFLSEPPGKSTDEEIRLSNLFWLIELNNGGLTWVLVNPCVSSSQLKKKKNYLAWSNTTYMWGWTIYDIVVFVGEKWQNIGSIMWLNLILLLLHQLNPLSCPNYILPTNTQVSNIILMHFFVFLFYIYVSLTVDGIVSHVLKKKFI